MTAAQRKGAGYVAKRNFTRADVREYHREPCLDGFEHVQHATDDATVPIMEHLWTRHNDRKWSY